MSDNRTYNYKDNNPYVVESANKLYVEYSHGDIPDSFFINGKYPTGYESIWIWENQYYPVEHTININGIPTVVSAHKYMRFKVGSNGKWTVPIRIVGENGSKGENGQDGLGMSNIEALDINTIRIHYGNGQYTDVIVTGGLDGTDGTDGISVTVEQLSNGIAVTGSNGKVYVYDGIEGKPFQVDSTGDIYNNGILLGLQNDTGRTPSLSYPYFHIVKNDLRTIDSNLIISLETGLKILNVTGHLIMTTDRETWYDYGVFTGIKGDKGDKGDTGIAGLDGINGSNGWCPVLATYTINEYKEVLQVIDWIGGTGTKPTTLGYVSTSGIVSNPSEATNIKGNTNVHVSSSTPTNVNVNDIWFNISTQLWYYYDGDEWIIIGINDSRFFISPTQPTSVKPYDIWYNNFTGKLSYLDDEETVIPFDITNIWITDRQHSLGKWLYYSSTTGDTIGDVRIRGENSTFIVQACTVTGSTKNSGTWSDIWPYKLTQNYAIIGNSNNRPSEIATITVLAGTGTLINGQCTIIDTNITTTSIVLVTPSITGNLTGQLRVSPLNGSVVVYSKDTSNNTILTDTVTFNYIIYI